MRYIGRYIVEIHEKTQAKIDKETAKQTYSISTIQPGRQAGRETER